MKIAEVSKNNFYNFKSNIKKPIDDKEKTKTKVVKLEPKQVPNPSFLKAQALYSIDKPTTLIIPTPFSTPFCFEVEPRIVKDYFSDKKGKNPDLINKYIELSAQLMNEISPQYIYKEGTTDEIDLAEEAKITLILDEDEEKHLDSLMQAFNERLEDDEFVRTLLEQIKINEKMKRAQELSDLDDETQAEIIRRALQGALVTFELSRTKDGFDFSQGLDKKKEIFRVYERVESEYGLDALDDIIKCSKDYMGNVDIDLALDIAKLMDHSDIGVSPKKVADVLKHFYSKDPNKKAQIFNTIRRLDEGVFALSEDYDDIETILEHCFDRKNKFDTTAASVLITMDEQAAQWLDEMNPDVSYYGIVKFFVRGVIEEYFDEAKDWKGKFRPLNINPKDYFMERAKNYRPLGCNLIN